MKPARLLPIFAVAMLLLTSLQSARAADKPKVLLIGDSISLGYTPFVLEMTKDSLDAMHHAGNAQHTGTGLARLDSWVGDTEWDVIHFNWGLWDLCYRNPESKNQGRRDKENGKLTLTVEEYEKNLDELVTRLQKTGAKLIWAHTTLVPEGELGRKVGDDVKYNDAAARVMKKHGVPINDLHALSASFPPELFTAPGNVHFKPEGSQRLAKQVVAAIEAVLDGKEIPAPVKE